MNSAQRQSNIDILQIDFEYCNIFRYSIGNPNSLGEPIRTIATIALNVKCAIDPVVPVMFAVQYAGILQNDPNGRFALETPVIWFNGEPKTSGGTLQVRTSMGTLKQIVQGDIIKDYDGNSYELLGIKYWGTHLNGSIRKLD